MIDSRLILIRAAHVGRGRMRVSISFGPASRNQCFILACFPPCLYCAVTGVTAAPALIYNIAPAPLYFSFNALDFCAAQHA